MLRKITDNTKYVFDLFADGFSWILQHKKSTIIFALLVLSGEAQQVKQRRMFTKLDCGLFEVIKIHEPVKNSDCYQIDSIPNILYCETTQQKMAATKDRFLLETDDIILTGTDTTVCKAGKKTFVELDCGTFDYVQDPNYKKPNNVGCAGTGDTAGKDSFQLCWPTKGEPSTVGFYRKYDLKNTDASKTKCNEIGHIVDITKGKFKRDL